MSLVKLRDTLKETGIDVHHMYAGENDDKYIVWAEEGEGTTTHYDNKLNMQMIAGTIDFFTKTEFDTDHVKIQDALTAAGIGFKLLSIQHEEDTGLYHYEWYFEV